MTETKSNMYLNKSLASLNRKSNVSKVRYNLFSIYSTVIQSTVLFPSNKDIRGFVDTLPLQRPVKDYLLSARPQIIARLITEINKASDENVYVLLDRVKDLVGVEIQDKAHKRSKNNSDNYIDSLLGKYSRGSENEI